MPTTLTPPGTPIPGLTDLSDWADGFEMIRPVVTPDTADHLDDEAFFDSLFGLNTGEDDEPVDRVARRRAIRTKRAADLDIAVPVAVREWLTDQYPGLKGTDRLSVCRRRLLQLFLFTVPADLNRPEYPVPCELLYAWAGLNRYGDRHGVKSEDLLQDFSDNVFKLKWSVWDSRVHRCRTVVPFWCDGPVPDVEIPARIRAWCSFYRIQSESDKGRQARARLVRLVSGRRVPKRRTDEFDEAQEYHRDLAGPLPADHPSRPILDLLERVGPGPVRWHYYQNVDKLRRELHETFLAAKDRNEYDSLNYTFSVLNSIDESGVAVAYGHRNNTSRVFTEGHTVLSLPKEYRRKLMPGCFELDLRNCQLAVCAKLFDCPLLTEFLKTGESIWDLLYRELGLDRASKPDLKKALYSIVFGKPEERIRFTLATGSAKRGERILKRDTQGIGGAKAAKFFTIPIIRELLDRRAAFLAEIRKNKGGYDAFGQWVPIVPGKRKPQKKKGRDAKKVAGTIVQSWETALMLALVPVLESQHKNGTEVLAWQHDGLTINIKKKDRVGRFLRQLEEAVAARAEEFGFETGLEIEEL